MTEWRFYTVGQRKRINVGSPIPLYVIALDPQSNTVVVGDGDDLLADALVAGDCNWIAVPGVENSLRVTAKIRYNMQSVSAIVEPAPGEPEDFIRVRFEASQRAVTPGQSVVLYDGDTVVGGGTIERAVGRGGAADAPQAQRGTRELV